MDKEKLLHIIRDNIEIKENDKIKLSCTKAHQIAADYNVSLQDIGDLCNDENIRIMHCQLQCF